MSIELYINIRKILGWLLIIFLVVKLYSIIINNIFHTGFYSLLITLAAFGAALYFKLPLHRVKNKMLQLITSGTIFCFVLSILLYIKARRGPKSKLAPGGNTGKNI